jgi:hypothetical protein
MECGEPVPEPFLEPAAEPALAAGPAPAAPAARRGRLWVPVVAIAAAAAAVCVLWFSGILGGGAAGVYYATEEGQWFSAMNGKDPVLVTSAPAKTGTQMALSADGKRLAYADYSFAHEGFNLYVREMGKPGKPAYPVGGVIREWSDLDISADYNTVAYISEGSLFLCDISSLKHPDPVEIDSGVQFFHGNVELTKIVYTHEGGGVYYYSEGMDRPERVSADGSFMNVEGDLSVFLVRDGGGALYIKREGAEMQLVSGGNVVETIGMLEGGVFYYVELGTSQVSYWDYVEDDLAEQDAQMQDPGDFPDIWDYSISELGQWGDDYAAHADLVRAWNAKLERDALRASLKEKTAEIEVASLYFFDGEKPTLVCEGYLYCNDIDMDRGRLICAKSPGVGEVKLPFSNEAFSENAVRLLIEQIANASALKHYYVDGAAAAPVGDTYAGEFQFFGDSGLAYIDEAEEDGLHGNLYRAAIEGGAVTGRELVASHAYVNGFEAYGADLFWFTDDKNGAGNLYHNGELVDTGVAVGSLVAEAGDGGAWYYYRDWDTASQAGTLMRYSGGQPEVVCEGVHEYIPQGDGRYVVLAAYSLGGQQGVLELVEADGEATVVADGVQRLLDPVNGSRYTGAMASGAGSDGGSDGGGEAVFGEEGLGDVL